MREPLRGQAIMAGLEDTFRQIDESSRKSAGRLAEALQEKPSSPREWDAALERLEHEAAELADRVGAASLGGDSAALASQQWAEAFLSQVRERRRELLSPGALAAACATSTTSRKARRRRPRPGLIVDLGQSRRRCSRVPAASRICAQVQAAQAEISTALGKSPEKSRLALLAEALNRCAADGLRERLGSLASRAEVLGAAMDFRPLYKPDRHLYSIGANLTQGQLDGPATTCLPPSRA